MNYYFNKTHTDKLIEKLKTKPQETLEFELDRQMETFSFSPPINLFEQGKWLLAVTSFEATNSFFTITNEEISISFPTPSYWFFSGGAETIYKLKNVLELRSQNDTELHVKEVKTRGNQIKIGDKEYNLSNLDTH